MTTQKVTLYIATHNQTGLKYFGKTTIYLSEKLLQENYHGSGTYWKRHLKQHGDDVTMEIYGIYSLEEVKEIALKFSEENNIIRSKRWANIIAENGINGGISRQWHMNTKGKKALLFFDDEQVISGEYVNCKKGTPPSLKNNIAVSKSNSGKAVYKDVNNNIIRTYVTDERVLSGELVGIQKNTRPHNALNIDIYDSDDNLIYSCIGNFKKYCDSIDIPAVVLQNSYLNNGKPIYQSKMSHCKPGREKYKGWYALKIK